MPTQNVKAPVMRLARRIDTDMQYAELGPDSKIAIVARFYLRPDIHRALQRGTADRSRLMRLSQLGAY
jgi:hypothetical protein